MWKQNLDKSISSWSEIKKSWYYRDTAGWGSTISCAWLSWSTSGNLIILHHPQPQLSSILIHVLMASLCLQHARRLHLPLGHAHPQRRCRWHRPWHLWRTLRRTLPPLPCLYALHLHLRHLLRDPQPGSPLDRPLALRRTLGCHPPGGNEYWEPVESICLQPPAPVVVLLPVGVPSPGMGDCVWGDQHLLQPWEEPIIRVLMKLSSRCVSLIHICSFLFVIRMTQFCKKPVLKPLYWQELQSHPCSPWKDICCSCE